MPIQRPTLVTLASRCGVSTSTVSRALTRPDMVNAEVRSLIIATAREMGYRPNKVARGLATGRVGRIGLLLPDVANPFFTELLRAVQHAASREPGTSVIIVNSDERPGAESDLITDVLAEVDGMILASPRAPAIDLKEAIGGAPAVLINRPLKGQDAVLIDYSDAIAVAARHLVEQGHNRIAMVRGPSASWASAQRANALTRWSRENDVETIDLGPGAATYETGVSASQALVTSRATAVIAYDDMVASGIVAGLHSLGRRVPEDVAVVGCDDTLLARLLTPALTTVSPPYDSVGAAALELLNARIRSPHHPARHVRFPCTVAMRESSQVQGPSVRRPAHSRAQANQRSKPSATKSSSVSSG